MRRLLTILAAGSLALAVAACGGDGDGDLDDNEPGAAETSNEPTEQPKRAAKTKPCTAEVSTTGAHEAEWGGKAEVRTGGKAADAPGPKAVYTLTDKKNEVSLYSPGNDFKGSVTLFVGKTAYSSDPADAASFDIDKRGEEAHVETTLTGVGGDTVDLVADFICGKRNKKK